MKPVEWSEHFLTGHEQTDQRHREIIDNLNDMISHWSSGNVASCAHSFGQCVDLCEQHIREENNVLLGLRDSEITDHMIDHEMIVKKLRNMNTNCRKICSGEACLSDTTHTILSHILRFDLEMQDTFGK